MTDRDRIRSKLCDQDRQFLDALRQLFPSARLTYLRFNDGETHGSPFRRR